MFRPSWFVDDGEHSGAIIGGRGGGGGVVFVFFFKDTATTEINTRSLVGSVRCV